MNILAYFILFNISHFIKLSFRAFIAAIPVINMI